MPIVDSGIAERTGCLRVATLLELNKAAKRQLEDFLLTVNIVVYHVIVFLSNYIDDINTPVAF